MSKATQLPTVSARISLPTFSSIKFHSHFFFFFWSFRAALAAYGGSQAGGPIRAADASHSHSNAGSEPGLRPTPQPTAMPDPQPPEQGQGSNLRPQGCQSDAFPHSQCFIHFVLMTPFLMDILLKSSSSEMTLGSHVTSCGHPSHSCAIRVSGTVVRLASWESLTFCVFSDL